jgi:hypothetical protein
MLLPPIISRKKIPNKFDNKSSHLAVIFRSQNDRGTNFAAIVLDARIRLGGPPADLGFGNSVIAESTPDYTANSELPKYHHNLFQVFERKHQYEVPAIFK